MEQNQFTQPGEQGRAILVSGKLFNPRVKPEGRLADELILPTKGRLSALSGLRYVPLVVSQTKAGNMSRQQTRKIGQVIPYD